MKLHRLELEGFGPFRERQTVDFDAFDDDGIFLIAGRTGAGKSSILDGVCFALYGGVPRYEGSEKRLRSDHCTPDDPTTVQLEFTVGSTRWRVTRSPEHERPKARGTGLTTVPHAATLEELVGGGWIGRAAKPRDVGQLLDEVLGLSQQQFLQVILLAQNRFAQFLLARNDDRQAVLRTLFGTRAYSDYQDAFDTRRRMVADRMAGGAARVDHLLEEAEALVAEHGLEGDGGEPQASDPAGRVRALERAARRAEYQADTRDRERDEAEAAHIAAGIAHAALVSLADRLERRAASRAALALLEEQAGAIAGDRARLETARTAELLRDPIARAERADRAASDAVAEAHAALTRWTGLGEPIAESAQLAERIERITGDLAVWAVAAAHETTLDRLTEALQESDRAVAAGAAALAEVDGRLAAYPDLVQQLQEELSAQERAAALEEAAASALAEAEARLAAARDAERLDGEQRAAETRYAEASAAAAVAAAGVTALLQRRLSGHAGELAAALVDGDPCAVCGSTSHPRPAHAAGEPVTDAMLEAAEAERDAAALTERATGDRARTVREAHSAASARAGGETVPMLTAALAVATTDLATARAAREHRDRLAADLVVLREAQQADAAARSGLDERLAEARRNAVVAMQQLAAARDAVAAARADFATVAERIADAEHRRTAARTLAEALQNRAEREREARAAADERDRQVGESAFADAAAVASALIGAEEQSAIAARVREHEVALRAETDRLRDWELELAGIDDDPPDLDASSTLVDEARLRWQSAVEGARRAADAGASLDRLRTRAAEAMRAIEDLAGEHATITALADAVAGRNARRMDLETFVLAAELEEIVAAANLRLDEMSAGRYLLRHTAAAQGRGAAGLGLEVVDAYTGQARPPQSLSGGETFLASLALALGLAQVVTERAGGIRLDTLFVDEGFGSLDADTLELAMRTLDELRQGGRTVGVISHVEAMKEQLPAQLVVRATPAGPSVVVQEARVAA